MICTFRDIYIPRPSKGVKFQPPGLFLVVKGPKYQTLGGFRYMIQHVMICAIQRRAEEKAIPKDLLDALAVEERETMTC